MILVSQRKLCIPQGERCIGFCGDNKVEVRKFVITDKELFGLDFRADIGNTAETVYLEKSISKDGERMILSWHITSAEVKNVPMLNFQLRGIQSDGDKVWHSEKDYFYCKDSFDEGAEISEQELDEFHTLEKLAQQHKNDAENFSLMAAEAKNGAESAMNEAVNAKNTAQQIADNIKSDIDELAENVYTKSETDDKINGIIVQEMGEDATKVLSQKALTEGLIMFSEAISGQIAEVDMKANGLEMNKASANDVYMKSQVYTKTETEGKIEEAVLWSEHGIFQKFDEVDEKIGDIESALDELHGYAQALIGGEA